MSRPYFRILDDLLIQILEIGFRFVDLGYRGGQVSCSGHASHLETIFRAASSGGDEVIADALYAWATDRNYMSHCPLEVLFHTRTSAGEPHQQNRSAAVTL